MEDYIPLNLQQGHFPYWLREYNPSAIYEHNQPRKPHELKQFVKQSKRIKTVTSEVAQKTGRTIEDVEKEVHMLLEEIGHKFSMLSVRAVGLVARAAICRICSGVYINKSGLSQLEVLMKTYPVVLLPSHRSYLDFLLVSYFMYEFGLQLPVIAAAQDFMKMSGVGALLRQSGAFFMRRTFGTDQLYWTVFSEYMQTQLHNGDAPMEFFIEGTRSRTAKPLHPRLGLLSVVMDCYLTGQVSDIQLVPISISYERTLEEQLFARELLGTPKPKESTRGLFAARTILSTNYGSIFIHIGSPVSLHKYCQQCGVSRIPHSVVPRHMPANLSAERKAVKQLAYHILHTIQSNMRLPYTSLVAAIVLQHVCDDGLTIAELLEEVKWLKQQIEGRGGQLMCHNDVETSVKLSLSHLEESVEVTPSGRVQLRLDTNHQEHVEMQKSFAEVMSMSLSHTHLDMIHAVSHTHLLLYQYRNQLLHVFSAEGILAMILNKRKTIDNRSYFMDFSVLCSSLCKDLFLPQQPVSELFPSLLWSMRDRGLLAWAAGTISSTSQSSHALSFLASLMTPFAVGVWLISKYMLSRDGDGAQTVSLTLKETQFLAARSIHAGLFHCYDVLSLDILKNAMHSLMEAGLLSRSFTDTDEGKERLVTISDRLGLQKVSDIVGTYVLPEVRAFDEKSTPAKL